MNIGIHILQVENLECFNRLLNTVQFSWNWELNQICLIPNSLLFSHLPSVEEKVCIGLYLHMHGD